MLATSLANQNRTDEAIVEYGKSIELEAKNTEAFTDRGESILATATSRVVWPIVERR